MAVSTTDEKFFQFYILLNETQKKSLLQVMQSFLKNNVNSMDLYEGIEGYNMELNEAEKEFENGEYITHDEMMKELNKWQQ